jgi:hypothetical protein
MAPTLGYFVSTLYIIFGGIAITLSLVIFVGRWIRRSGFTEHVLDLSIVANTVLGITATALALGFLHTWAMTL